MLGDVDNGGLVASLLCRRYARIDAAHLHAQPAIAPEILPYLVEEPRVSANPKSPFLESCLSPSMIRTPRFKWSWLGCQNWRTLQSAGLSRFCETRRGHPDFCEVATARRSLAKARSAAMNRASIGAISFVGSTTP